MVLIHKAAVSGVAMPVSDPISRVGRQALMRKPKSIQGATKIPINQCDRLRTLACFLSMAGRGRISLNQAYL